MCFPVSYTLSTENSSDDFDSELQANAGNVEVYTLNLMEQVSQNITIADFTTELTFRWRHCDVPWRIQGWNILILRAFIT